MILTSSILRKQIKDNFPDLTPEQIESALNNELLARNNVHLKHISSAVGWLLTITVILVLLAVFVGVTGVKTLY
jgi:hypothetical protein